MSFTKEVVDFKNLDTDSIKEKLSQLNIPLTPEEALKIQNEMLERAPSIAELVLFSIQGSEHCSYKSSRIHLGQFVTESPDVVLGAKEDAGVVAVATDNQGKRWCVVMSHESHNHPSQIVPFEGAATGVGGNVRDVMCMGAEVIACTDSFRFGEINSNKTKWIHDGVVSGVAGYGNPLGIPNIGGDVYYHKGYNENCLVTLVTLGIVKEDEIIHSYAPKNAEGYDLILIGKPTDNSGFGGASFASLELEEDKKDQNKGAVQEPNAFLERHLLKSSYALFDEIKKMGFIDRVGFKDLGAGGVACASVELAEASGYGSEVWLDKVHTSMDGLHSSVYLCSETQERFMWVCPPDMTKMIVEHYNVKYNLPEVSDGAMASVIGKIRSDGQYIVHYNDEIIVDAKADQVTKGFLYERPFSSSDKKIESTKPQELNNYNDDLVGLLSHENIASRKPIYDQYDKQVQGRVILESGQGDSGIIAPFNSEDFPSEIRSTGIALSTDHNPLYGSIDPYWAGVNAVVESMRNIASVGATPHALTDCLCFGNPEKENQMWEFVQSVRGISDACSAIGLKQNPNHPTPIIAGNVSFYNESKNGSIPASPIVSCLGKLENVEKAISMSFQDSDSNVILIGKRKSEMGGSAYYYMKNKYDINLPKPDFEEVKNQIYALTDCIDKELVLSCHDISDGGLAVALSEMSFKNNIGCKVSLNESLRSDEILFSETGGFVMEVSNATLESVRGVFSQYKINLFNIGKTGGNSIVVNNILKVDVNEARKSWENGLSSKL